MTKEPQILCAGSALWDIIARTDRTLKPGFDVPGRITRQMGGVALNVALALAARGVAPVLLSAVGLDPQGDRLLASATAAGVNCTNVARISEPTDAYLAIEDSQGEVFGAVADCASLERRGEEVLTPLRDGSLGSEAAPSNSTIVFDGNFPQAILDALPDDPAFAAAHLALVPASPGKAERLRKAMRHPNSTLYVNRIEAEILCRADFTSAALAARALLREGAARVIVTDSHRPAAAAQGDHLWTAAPPSVTAHTTTGAGDAFLAAHLSAEPHAATQQEALDAAVAAAAAHVARAGGMHV
ncbi:PfkB family carbohydrate kinase [Oceanibium sediminis]|uniref:PfkB family carbohydrate kinase n=1 Tax=Oceanibium sediminis TaxID=2026339 RepID=UPI001E62D865|nr:PfkB family carbohydrate kinase [Oceanibium sediminis]